MFTQTATGLELEVDTISLGTQTEEDFERAAGQLMNTGTKASHAGHLHRDLASQHQCMRR